MLNRMFPIIVPILAFATAITGIVAIGELLLFAAHTFNVSVAVAIALGLTLLAGLIGALLSLRAAKLPPVQWPNPGPTEPVRRLDLGAGYLVGQFVLIFGVALLLLFVILAVK